MAALVFSLYRSCPVLSYLKSKIQERTFTLLVRVALKQGSLPIALHLFSFNRNQSPNTTFGYAALLQINPEGI